MATDVYNWLGKKLFSKPGLRDPMKTPKALERFRTELRAWLEREIAPHVPELDRQPTEALQLELVRKAGQAGWLTMLVPKHYGGDLGMIDFFRFGLLKAAIFTEEIAAVCPGVCVLFGAHTLGLLPLFISFDPRILKRFLRLVAERSRSERPALFAFAITEPSAGSDVEDTEGSRKAKLSTFARRENGGYVLNGRKCFISGGNLATHVTVFAALEHFKGSTPSHPSPLEGEGEGGGEPGRRPRIESWTAFVVPTDAKGFSIGRVEHKMGQRASPAAELILEDVRVPEDHRVGAEGEGWRLNHQTLDLSRPAVGAIALGSARYAFEKAMTIARESGCIAHRDWQYELADLAIKIEAARTLVWRAASTFPPDPALSAMSKCFASDVSMDVCSRVIDLVGEAGVTQAAGIEKAFRDVKLTQIYEGTNQIQRMRIAESWGTSVSTPPALPLQRGGDESPSFVRRGEGR